MFTNRLLSATVFAAILIPTTAIATNGMFMMGNGTKANGRAGVGIAIADSAISGADNPAAMVRVGNRVDFGIQIFDPDRTAEIKGNDISNVSLPADQLNQLNSNLQAAGAPPNYMQPGTTCPNTGCTYGSTIPGSGAMLGLPQDIRVADAFGQGMGISGAQVLGMFNYKDDGNNDGPFFIPEGGFNYMLSNNMSVGVVVVGTGGMNTNYSNLAMFGAAVDGSVAGESGINVEQVKILPTLSYKINDNHSVGVSLQIAYQQFKSWGLNRFTSTTPQNGQVSQAPNKLSGKGREDSWGYGISVGWQGDFMNDRLTVGLVYNSKIDMEELDDYQGLFADKGDFDVAENYGIGIAFKATDALLLGFDIQQINYSGVDSISNSLQSGPNNSGGDMFNPANYLGTSNGSGFGWNDMTVYKLGGEYQWNKDLTLRAGYSHADQPIDKDQTMFNILAPAVIEDHATIGMTYTLPHGSQISMFYMHAFENSVSGNNSIPDAFGGGEADIKMSQNAYGIAYGWSF